jgi:ZIP family zinc transporter
MPLGAKNMPIHITLGLIAGGTIFLGLPVAKLSRTSAKTRGFLNALSTGILIFLLVEILGKVLEAIEELLQSGTQGFQTLPEAFKLGSILLAGLSAGLLGMVLFEQRFIGTAKDDDVPEETRGRQIATMIAIGIGIHNLTEGLAIAQAYSWGNSHLGIFLAVGFGLHNATEGFGIAAPLSGKSPSWKFLLWMGFIGGAPTILGTVIGSFWQSHELEVLAFGLAAGAILYIIGEMMHIGRKLKGEAIIEVGLLAGFALAFVTEMLITVVG